MDEEGKPARRQTSPSSRASAGISQIVNGQALSATASRTFVTTSDHGFITSRPHLLCSCLKLASRALLRSRLTTPYPCGAKAALLAKLPYAVGSFHPSGQPCGLAKRPCRRRPFSRSFAAHYLQIVNRKWSGFFLGRMCYVTLNVPPLYHIPQHLAKTKNAPVSRLQLPSDVIILVFSTIDGTRTRTARKPGDFKSPASTDSATMARAAHCTTFPSKKQAMLFHTEANATFVPIKFSPASFNPFLRVWDARHTTSRRFLTTPAQGFQNSALL